MPVKSSGSLSISELITYYGKSGQTSLSSFYKTSNFITAKAPPISALNASVPSSGTISMSNLYGSYRWKGGASGNITAANSSTGVWHGYQEGSAIISNPQIGSFSGTDTYTDGNSATRRFSGLLFNTSTSTLYFKTATDSTINNDAGVYLIYMSGGNYPFGVEFYTSAAASTGMQGTPGSAQYGRYWTWSASNPFTLGSTTYISVEFLQ